MLTRFTFLPRPRWRGFSFALHLLRVQGFSFCPDAMQPHTSVYSAFYAVSEFIPHTPQNSAHGFTSAFSAICPILTPQIPDRQKRLYYHLRHAGAYHSAVAHPAHTRYQRHAGRCTSQHSRPIIIRYIRVHGCAPVVDSCQTVQHTTDHASPAGSPAVAAEDGRNHWWLVAALLFGLSPDSQ